MLANLEYISNLQNWEGLLTLLKVLKPLWKATIQSRWRREKNTINRRLKKRGLLEENVRQVRMLVSQAGYEMNHNLKYFNSRINNMSIPRRSTEYWCLVMLIIKLICILRFEGLRKIPRSRLLSLLWPRYQTKSRVKDIRVSRFPLLRGTLNNKPQP